MQDVKPEDLLEINAKSLWVVIRNTKTKEGNPEEYLRQKFPPEWVIVNLSYPLRHGHLELSGHLIAKGAY